MWPPGSDGWPTGPGEVFRPGRVGPESVKRLKDKIRGPFRSGRGRSLWRTINALTPLLRGWGNYLCQTRADGGMGMGIGH
ncbi:MAG: group II intron maturase-specific domain-containing protein [Limnochordia bacterium]